MPWIHVKDLTGLMLHAIEEPAVNGIVNGVAPDPITNDKFVQAFASSLSR